MNDQLMDVLRALAEKFGTTTEFLWGIMVKQAYVVGITQTATFVLSLVSILGWNYAAWRIRLPQNPQDDRGGDKTFGIMWLRLLGAFFACIWVMAFLCGLTDISTALVNPEYWALHQIIGGKK